MPEREVTVIPPTKCRIPHKAENAVAKRKAAGYARVSTDKDEQFTSYEAQVDYYTQFILKHSDWEFVKVYTDEGISGLGTKKRDGFNEMIADALVGKIDIIVTKSVSRFARNTVDSLTTIRKLKEKGVEVLFEKENISSLDGKGELLLTIMSSLAQEESRSISENVTWGQRKRFSDGKVTLPYKHFLGYEHGPQKDDPPVVNHDQAIVVRRIYQLFMSGKTPYGIATQLTSEGLPTPAGKQRWHTTTVQSILTNEKYRGSARLQKRFTTDFLTGTMKWNEGEVPQYYIEHSHEPIIDPVEWDAVQDEIERRHAIGQAYSGGSVFSAKIVCGCCGRWYGRKTWHSTDKYKSTVWQCNAKYDAGSEKCGTPHITEDEIKRRFLNAYNSVIDNRDEYLIACRAAKTAITDTSKTDEEINRLDCEIEVVTGLVAQLVRDNSSQAQNQDAYNDRYNTYIARYNDLQNQRDALLGIRTDKARKARSMDRFIRELSRRNSLITEFDNCLWFTVLDVATIHEDGTITFRFYDGTEVVN